MDREREGRKARPTDRQSERERQRHSEHLWVPGHSSDGGGVVVVEA